MRVWLDVPGSIKIRSYRGGRDLTRLGVVYCMLLCLTWALLASSVWGQAAPEKSTPAPALNQYKAAVTADKVRVRSGPGTNYYECGQLNKGDTVQVKGSQAGWSRIVPPPGSFSWIAMKYISINADAPSIGILTGDGIVVYAGSDYEEPMHSVTKQVTLKRGAKVTLLNEEKDGYFKIVPPAGSDLWVSSQYLKRAAPAPKPAISTPPGAATSGTPQTPQGQETNVTSSQVKPVSPESELLQQYKKLLEEIETEKAKPLAEQDYASLKKAFTEMAAKKEEAREIAGFADVWLKRIALYEFGINVARQLAQQQKQLDQANTRIQKAKSQRLAGLKNMGRYAVTGTLRPSSVYGVDSAAKRYRIVGDKGKTRCYVEPVGAAVGADMTPYFGKKVGLVGTIKAHPAAGGALVEFTAIETLE